jgi:SAM-dependent methyltransferase
MKLSANIKSQRGLHISPVDFALNNPQSDCYHSPEFRTSYLHSLRLRAIAGAIRKYNPRPGAGRKTRLVELGCGDGYLLHYLSAQFPLFSFTGLDSNPVRLRRARERLKGMEIRRESAPDTSFPPDFFDIAVCSEVLEHVREDQALLDEIHRILKPKGLAVITTPNLWTLPNRIKKLRGRAPEIYVPDHLREHSRAELTRKVRSAGLDIIEFYSLGFYLPRMLLFSRCALLVKLIFSGARFFPSAGRIFIVSARKG